MSDFEALKKELLINLTNAPISEKILSRRLGVNDRVIRDAIVSLIEEKHLILSNTHGVWIESDPQVVLDYCERIYNTGMAYMKKQSDLKKAVAEKFGQLSLSL